MQGKVVFVFLVAAPGKIQLRDFKAQQWQFLFIVLFAYGGLFDAFQLDSLANNAWYNPSKTTEDCGSTTSESEK